MKKVNILTGRLAAVFLTLGFIIYFVFAMVDTGNSIDDNATLLASYQAALTEQEIISDSIDIKERIEGTDEHVEQIARERLGLCKSNEVLYVEGS